MSMLCGTCASPGPATNECDQLIEIVLVDAQLQQIDIGFVTNISQASFLRLAGESQPLVKDSIANLDDVELALDINGEHKSHILNSGTEILQFTPSDNMKSDVGQLADLPPGVEGIVCYVLKNGFETKQGKLMRVILFSQDRVSVE